MSPICSMFVWVQMDRAKTSRKEHRRREKSKASLLSKFGFLSSERLPLHDVLQPSLEHFCVRPRYRSSTGVEKVDQPVSAAEAAETRHRDLRIGPRPSCTRTSELQPADGFGKSPTGPPNGSASDQRLHPLLHAPALTDARFPSVPTSGPKASIVQSLRRKGYRVSTRKQAARCVTDHRWGAGLTRIGSAGRKAYGAPEAQNRRVTAIRLRLIRELRARSRAWIALALLVGVAGGAVLLTAAGARRTDSAYARYLRASHASDLLVAPSLNGYDAVLARLPVASRRSPARRSSTPSTSKADQSRSL